MIDLCLELDSLRALLCSGSKSFKRFNILPKQHHLLHYSELIRYYSPLVLFSTLKYERKHLYFKNFAEVTCNRINLEKSFAVRHQMYCALLFATGEYQSMNFFEVDETKLVARILHTMPTEPEYRPLSSSKSPRSVSKFLIFNILGTRGHSSKQWFQPTRYWQSKSDESIIVEGNVFKLTVNRRQNCLFPTSLSILYGGKKKFIQHSHLNHQIDYIFHPDSNYYLFRGMI